LLSFYFKDSKEIPFYELHVSIFRISISDTSVQCLIFGTVQLYVVLEPFFPMEGQ